MCYTTPATILPIVKHLYRRYKFDAIRRGKEFDISLDYFNKIIHEPCAYCGVIEDNCYTQNQYAIKVLWYNGVDRIDSAGDYTEANTIACCGECNRAKSDRDTYFLTSQWLMDRKVAMARVFNGRVYSHV